MKLFILLSFLSVTTVSHAALMVGKCGDHWFNASFEVETDIGVGTFYLGGDSGENRSFSALLVKHEGTNSFKLVSGKTYLSVSQFNGTDHFFGRYSENGTEANEVDLGICLINKK